jgi:hypothetical protein
MYGTKAQSRSVKVHNPRVHETERLVYGIFPRLCCLYAPGACNLSVFEYADAYIPGAITSCICRHVFWGNSLWPLENMNARMQTLSANKSLMLIMNSQIIAVRQTG